MLIPRFPFLFGICFLTTAALKVLSPAPAIVSLSHFLGPSGATYAFLLGAVCEIVLGTMLLLRCAPLLTWVLTVVFVCMLAVAALAMAVDGAHACGCLGPVQSSPRLMLGLDIIALGVLLYARKRFYSRSHAHAPPPNQYMPFRLAASFIAVLLTVGVVVRTVDLLRPLSFSAHNGHRVAILEPSQWIGRQFPLSSHIDGSLITRKRCILVLTRSDCDKCRHLLAQLARMRDETVVRDIVVLSLPSPNASMSASAIGEIESYELSGDVIWIAETPIVVELRSGIVTAASRGSSQMLHLP